MNLADLFDNTLALSKSSVQAVRAYPIEDIDEDEQGEVEVKNISLQEKNLKFDIEITDIDVEEYDFVKVIFLREQDLGLLANGNFPISVNEGVDEFLFSAGQRNETVYRPNEEIKDVQVRIDDTTGGEFIILISFCFDNLLDGDVFLISVNRADVIKQTRSKEAGNEFMAPSRKDDSITKLELVSEKTFISNPFLSYSVSGDLSGFYAIDAEKMLSKFTKFPNLIDVDNTQQFGLFLYKTELMLTKYDKQLYGNNLDNFKYFASPTRVEDITVENSGGKIFYDFFISNVSSVCDYEIEINFNFNDITIKLAQEQIRLLRIAQKNKDRIQAAEIINGIYGELLPVELRNDLVNINSLSIVDFSELIDQVAYVTQERIDSAVEKTDRNANIKSQYASPSPSFFNNFELSLTEKIKERIKLTSDKVNTFYKLSPTATFKTVQLEDVESITSEFVLTETKNFLIAPKIEPITKFSSLTTKGDKVTETGLVNRAEFGDDQRRADEKLITPKIRTDVGLTTVNERTIKLSYLQTVGNSVSALIYTEVEGYLDDLIQVGQKILVRLNNYHEFYDSYFYVENQG